MSMNLQILARRAKRNKVRLKRGNGIMLATVHSNIALKAWVDKVQSGNLQVDGRVILLFWFHLLAILIEGSKCFLLVHLSDLLLRGTQRQVLGNHLIKHWLIVQGSELIEWLTLHGWGQEEISLLLLLWCWFLRLY